MFYNRNEFDPTKWGYVADTSRPALSGGRGPLQPALRLTFQLSSRDKLNLFWDEQISNNSLGAGSATNAPETGGRNHGWQRVQQVKWTSTPHEQAAPRRRPRHVLVELEHTRTLRGRFTAVC